MVFSVKMDQKLLDQIMFINVLRKSPQKQFTGETYRFTIILDTSASSTSKSSTLTSLAESHPVPMNRSTAPSSGPPMGCVFQSSGSSNESNRTPGAGACSRVWSLHIWCQSFIIHISKWNRWRAKKTQNQKKNKNTSVTRRRYGRQRQLSSVCHTAQMHLVQQSNKHKHLITEKKKPRWNLWTHKDTRSINLLMLEKCPTPSLRTLNDKLRWR